jgi:DNA repair ATPase RecN
VKIASGFTAVTGETGAGKSIIIGALQLLVGERADVKYVATVTLMLARRRARVAGLE